MIGSDRFYALSWTRMQRGRTSSHRLGAAGDGGHARRCAWRLRGGCVSASEVDPKSRGERVAKDDVARAERARLLVPRHGEAEVRGQPDARRRHVELAVREARVGQVDADALQSLPLRLVHGHREGGAHLRRGERVSTDSRATGNTRARRTGNCRRDHLNGKASSSASSVSRGMYTGMEELSRSLRWCIHLDAVLSPRAYCSRIVPNGVRYYLAV